MNQEEDKFHDFLAETLRDHALENPPSANYTSQVMRNVLVAHASKAGSMSLGRKLLIAGLIAIQISILSVIIYFLNDYYNLLGVWYSIEAYLADLLSFLPFSISPWAIIAVIIHFGIMRLAISYFLVPRRNKHFFAN
ncbi:MAG: hypothetical protein AAFX87_28515 [Bacteroidota bacterium]